jgi:hypothetical protein
MLGALILATLGGLVITYVFTWLGWALPTGWVRDIFYEYGQFLTSFTSLGIGYIVSVKANLNVSTKHLKIFAVACQVSAIVCLISVYYFNYLHWKPVAIAYYQKDYSDPERTLDQYIRQQTGQSGFIGYFVWSANTSGQFHKLLG